MSIVTIIKVSISANPSMACENKMSSKSGLYETALRKEPNTYPKPPAQPANGVKAIENDRHLTALMKTTHPSRTTG